ncbi:MAG: hypothetical protein KBD15_03535 [Candidatus Magasanikbacteria bacterium]|nr:hypothetical protein [Candidatus Magasanikbacteria bacterium]
MPLEERDAQVYTFTKRLSHRGVFAIILGILVILVLGIVFFIKYRTAPQALENETQQETTPQTQETVPEELETSSLGEEFLQFETDTNSPFPDDADRDGLLDEQELSLGTSNTDIDSDNDGVSDTDELEIWNTSPTNPDTDGDGYTDGFEIFSGYNPAGEGPLDAKFLDEEPTQ